MNESASAEQAGAQGRGWGRLPELALVMATGSAVIAAAFAGSREGYAWAGQVYWAGQVIIYAAPACFLLCRKHVNRTEAAGIALLMPTVTYLIREYYSPGRFRFLDEFDHVQTAQSILTSHHLFHANTILSVSPQYPGLEIITTSLVWITHLSITTSGLIIVGMAHVLAGVALYLLVVETTGRPRVGALASVIYATGPHYQFFDSYFIYQNIAIPFLIFALLAAVRMTKRRGPTAVGWGMVSMACGAMTAVSHPVTSYVLVALIFAFVVAQYFLPPNYRSRGLVLVFLGVCGVVAIWDLGVATNTVGYLRPVIDGLLPGHSSAPSPTGGAVIPHSAGVSGKPPVVETVFEYVGFFILLALTPLGAWTSWHRRRFDANAAALGLAIASTSILVALALRVAASDGSELASRTLTFALIPISFVIALRMVDWVLEGRSSNHRKSQKAQFVASLGGAVIVVLVAVGGIAGGWPAFYARLPGPYRVSAWERSVDEHNVDLSEWFAAGMPRDQGVASDFWTEGLVAALGHQADVGDSAALFLPLHYWRAQGKLARRNRVSFVVVDRRITRQLPATGYYFENDPQEGHYTSPVPHPAIRKFETIPGVSRVYDDGTIVVYELIGSEYYK